MSRRTRLIRQLGGGGGFGEPLTGDPCDGTPAADEVLICVNFEEPDPPDSGDKAADKALEAAAAVYEAAG